MRKITITIVFAIILYTASAQSSSVFIRHDNTVLSSSDANWLLPPASIPNSARTVSDWFLQSIYNGKIRAVDPDDSKPIPGDQIYSWRMPSDTVAVYDNNLETVKYEVVKKVIDPGKIDRIRIRQDWYFNSSTGKIYSHIRSVELMIRIYSSAGIELGYRPYCRINY